MDDEATRMADLTARAAEARALFAPASPTARTPHLVADRENAVFRIDLHQGAAALRLHRRGYQQEEAIRSELWWMQALADAGLRVPRPISLPGGDLVARLIDGRLATAVTWLDGDPIGAGGRPLAQTGGDRTGLFERLGGMLSQLHLVTDRWQPPPGFRRPRWDLDGLLGEAPFWGRFWEHPALSAAEGARLSAARHHLRQLIADFAAAGADQGLIHADVLRENVLDGPAGLCLIDFDDCGQGFRLYDLGTALSQCLDEPDFGALRDALIRGYDRVRPLSAADRGMVMPFTLMRTLASVGWVAPRLAPDHPRHRAYIDRALALMDRMLS